MGEGGCRDGQGAEFAGAFVDGDDAEGAGGRWHVKALVEGESLVLHLLPCVVAEVESNALAHYLGFSVHVIAADEEDVEEIVPAVATLHRAELAGSDDDFEKETAGVFGGRDLQWKVCARSSLASW